METQKLLEFARHVARELDALTEFAWKADTENQKAVTLVSNSDKDFPLTLRVNDHAWNRKGRFHVGLWMYANDPYEYERINFYDHAPRALKEPEIGVSLNISAERMARDIGRRLLPDAVPYWMAAVKQYESHKDYTKKQLLLVDAIVEIGKGTIKKHSNDKKESRFSVWTNGKENISGEGYATSERVYFTRLSLPAEIAARIARIFAEFDKHENK